MIRFANNNDINNIINLWEKCFGKNDFSEWYFKTQYSCENTLVHEENGEISSMLQRLSYEISNVGKVTYIFGACTSPEYRNSYNFV